MLGVQRHDGAARWRVAGQCGRWAPRTYLRPALNADRLLTIHHDRAARTVEHASRAGAACLIELLRRVCGAGQLADISETTGTPAMAKRSEITAREVAGHPAQEPVR